MLTEAQNKFLEELYKSTFNLLKIYAISAVGDNPQAEELVQDTFTVACNKIEKLEESPNKIGWLLITLKNVIQNKRRTEARMSKYLTLYIANNRDLLDKQFEDQHIDMLYGDMIPAEDFALLKKLIFDKSTVLEAAEELNISVEACKKRAQRAKFRLKENIEKSQEPKVYRRYVKKNGEFFLSKKKNTGKTIESSDMKSGRSEKDGNTSETSGKTIGTDKGKLHEKNGAEPQIDGKSPPSDGKTFQNG